MVMRRILVAGTVLCLAWGTPASAQLLTHDPITSAVLSLGISKETIETVKNGITELKSLETEVQQLQQWYYIGDNLIHSPNLGAVMQLMQAAGISQDLPINPMVVGALVSGIGGPQSFGALSGKLSLLGSLANSNFTRNNLYTCTNNSFECLQSQQKAASIAGVQGISGAVYSDLTNHLNVLAGLRQRLLTASDPKTVADVTAQIAVEQAWVQNQQAQLQSVSLLQAAQQRSDEQSATERFHEDNTATMVSLKASMAGYFQAAPQ